MLCHFWRACLPTGRGPSGDGPSTNLSVLGVSRSTFQIVQNTIDVSAGFSFLNRIPNENGARRSGAG